MIYSNTMIQPETVKYDFGEINQVRLGEVGRGRKPLCITVGNGIGKDSWEGLKEDLTIGTTKSGKPKMLKGNDGLFLILSSKGGYTRRGCGYVLVNKEHQNNVKVIARGNGADGDAGRIGSWSVVLIKIIDPNKPVDIVVQYGGGVRHDYIVVREGKIYRARGEEEVRDLIDTLDLDIPSYSDDWSLDATHRKYTGS